MTSNHGNFESIECRELRVVDHTGLPRVIISTLSADNTPWLQMNDATGFNKITMEVNHEGNPVVAVNKISGATAVGIGVDSGGDAGISISPEGMDSSLIIKTVAGQMFQVMFLHNGKVQVVWESPPLTSHSGEDIGGGNAQV